MASSANERPVVYISHDVADRSAAATVSTALADAGYAPWTLNEVYPGENVLLKAGRALDRAEAIVVLLSPASVESSAHRFVLEFAVNGDRFAGRLIPVLLEPTPDVPWFLEHLEPIRAHGRLKQACKKVVDRLQHAVAV
jgi:hypothetical protein